LGTNNIDSMGIGKSDADASISHRSSQKSKQLLNPVESVLLEDLSKDKIGTQNRPFLLKKLL